jgi:hypothetical protein
MDSGLVHAKMRSRPGMTAFILSALPQAKIASGASGEAVSLEG